MKSIAIILFLISSSAQASDWYIGDWKVTDAKFPGTSAMDMDEAKVWFGSVATYTKEKVTFRNEICKNPVFKVESLTEYQFLLLYRATFDELRIDGDVVEILDVGCPSDWIAAGSILIKANTSFGYTLWDGVFFKINKMKKYRLIINGQNFLINIDGKEHKLGFYQTIFVEDQDTGSAESLAVEKIRSDNDLKNVTLNANDDPPMIYVDKISEVDEISEDDLKLESGRSFYPEKKWWQFWK